MGMDPIDGDLRSDTEPALSNPPVTAWQLHQGSPCNLQVQRMNERSASIESRWGDKDVYGIKLPESIEP
jgi:hypothetical protein